MTDTSHSGGAMGNDEGEDGECGDGSEYGGSNIASRSCCRRTGTGTGTGPGTSASTGTGAGYAVSAIDSHCDAPGDA